MARVLVLNAGSSSLKASVIEVGRAAALAEVSLDWGADATRAADRPAAVAEVLRRLRASDQLALELVGHRLVHGGARFLAPAVLDQAVLAELEELSALAPLHNPIALETARAAMAALPAARHVAVFDTAFHATLAEPAHVYPLPWHWHTEWGVRRFGFHGLSVEWAVRRAAPLLGRQPADVRLVVAHLGSGCSASAVEAGRSAATTMGMTPLEGLMMGTRAGSFDPGNGLRLLRERRLSLDELTEALEHGAGLLGVSGLSSDVRELERAAAGGDRRSGLALELFVRRAAEGIAATASALPALDALVFTGGIGENAGALRARIVARLAVMGL